MCSLLHRPMIHRVAVAAAARSIPLKSPGSSAGDLHAFYNRCAGQSYCTFQACPDLCQSTIEVNVPPIHEQVLPGRVA
jgi:hypothetical protein